MLNNDFLSRAGIPSMFTFLHQHHLCWLGHIQRMEDGYIPKCGDYPQLCVKDIYKHNMKACNITTESWEAFTDNRTLCKQQVSQELKRGEAAIWEKTMKDRPGEQTVNSRSTQTNTKHPSLHARAAPEISNSGLASTATQDDARQWPLTVLLRS